MGVVVVLGEPIVKDRCGSGISPDVVIGDDRDFQGQRHRSRSLAVGEEDGVGVALDSVRDSASDDAELSVKGETRWEVWGDGYFCQEATVCGHERDRFRGGESVVGEAVGNVERSLDDTVVDGLCEHGVLDVLALTVVGAIVEGGITRNRHRMSRNGIWPVLLLAVLAENTKEERELLVATLVDGLNGVALFNGLSGST